MLSQHLIYAETGPIFNARTKLHNRFLGHLRSQRLPHNFCAVLVCLSVAIVWLSVNRDLRSENSFIKYMEFSTYYASGLLEQLDITIVFIKA